MAVPKLARGMRWLVVGGASAALLSPVGVAYAEKADKKSTNLFDPEALERGAKALREINQSPHAKQVCMGSCRRVRLPPATAVTHPLRTTPPFPCPPGFPTSVLSRIMSHQRPCTLCHMAMWREQPHDRLHCHTLPIVLQPGGWNHPSSFLQPSINLFLQPSTTYSCMVAAQCCTIHPWRPPSPSPFLLIHAIPTGSQPAEVHLTRTHKPYAAAS